MRHGVVVQASTLLLIVFCFMANPIIAGGNAEDALFQAHEKMLGSRCVTESVATSGNGAGTRTTVEFDTVKRLRVTTEAMSLVILPEGTWMRTGDGEWTKPPIDMSALVKRLVPSTVEEIRAATSNVKDLGMQSVDGQQYRAISYDLNMTIMGIAVATQNTVYLDGSGRIVRTVSDGTAMGQTSHTVQTIRYDDSIRVNAPG